MAEKKERQEMAELEALKKKRHDEAEASRSFKGKSLAEPTPSPTPSPKSPPPPSPPPSSPLRHFTPPRAATPPIQQTTKTPKVVPPTTVGATMAGMSRKDEIIARCRRQVNDLLAREKEDREEIAQLKKEAEEKDNLIVKLTRAGLESSTHEAVEVLKKGMQQVRDQNKILQDHYTQISDAYTQLVLSEKEQAYVKENKRLQCLLETMHEKN